MMDARRASGVSQVDISFPEIEKFDHLPPAKVDGPTAFVSIMEGCSKYCSYCVVPYTRGDEVSRPLEDVLTEIAGLADQGVREVTLLGQNVNAYRGLVADSAEPADFATLIEYVAEIPGIERIRYTTSHPKEFTQRLIDAYARIPKLVSHLHLPVQHGSDRILMAMKRGYSILEYKSIVRRLRAIRPDLSLSTDFIVGFPGETEDDFAKLMALVEEMSHDGELLVHLQSASRHAGCQPARRHATRSQTGALAIAAIDHRRECPAYQRCHDRQRPACAGGRAVAQGRVRAVRAHRQQSRGQFRRAPACARTADRPDDRCAGEPCLPAFAAWRAGDGRSRLGGAGADADIGRVAIELAVAANPVPTSATALIRSTTRRATESAP